MKSIIYFAICIASFIMGYKFYHMCSGLNTLWMAYIALLSWALAVIFYFAAIESLPNHKEIANRVANFMRED